jgi:hypothetical protein
MRFPWVSLPFFSLVRELSYWERRDATVVPAGGCLRSCLVRCVANGRDEAWRAAHREMGVWLRGTSFPILGFVHSYHKRVQNGPMEWGRIGYPDCALPRQVRLFPCIPSCGIPTNKVS